MPLLLGALAVACLLIMIIFVFASFLGSRISAQNLQILSRVLGIILAAIGVQFMLAGLAASTTGVFNLKAISG